MCSSRMMGQTDRRMLDSFLDPAPQSMQGVSIELVLLLGLFQQQPHSPSHRRGSASGDYQTVLTGTATLHPTLGGPVRPHTETAS